MLLTWIPAWVPFLVAIVIIITIDVYLQKRKPKEELTAREAYRLKMDSIKYK